MNAPVAFAVDLQALQVEGFVDRGIGRYVAGCASALCRGGRVAAALLAPELPPPAALPDELARARLLRWDGMGAVRELLASGLPLFRYVPAPFLHSAPDDPAAWVVTPHWAAADVPTAVTLHDLIPLRAPRHYLPSEGHIVRYRARADWVARAQLIFTNSRYTRNEAIELLGVPPERVVVAGAGISAFFSGRDGTDDELFRMSFPALGRRPFVLVPAGNDTRKGVERVLAAVGRLVGGGADVDVVVAGELGGPWRERAVEAARVARIEDRVVFTGFMRDELLRACYRRAEVTVLASLAEGFGLPVLESAACGTPAAVSASSALVEVAGRDEAKFDPRDADSIAETLDALISDPQRMASVLVAQQELARASTWEAVARRMAEAVDQWAASDDRTRRTRRVAGPGSPAKRLALVGPVPPMEGGIAACNRRLLDALAASASVGTVDVVSPLDAPTDLPDSVRHIPADAFGPDARPASYDAVVYTLGNSSAQLPFVELALRHPGWLWLHEVRLPGIAVTALGDLDEAAFSAQMERILSRSYPGRAPHAAARRAGRSVLDLAAAGIGFVPLLAANARGLLVNSHYARHLLEMDLLPLGHHPPVHVLPPPCPDSLLAAYEDGATRQRVVVSFGIVSMAKCPDVLVDAAATGGFDLAFVGPCPGNMRQVIADRAEIRGIADRVTVTGPVDAAEWRAWLARAGLAVQLRRTVSGESSAAVLDALAAGVPTVTNLASAADYGEESIEMLASIEPAEVARVVAALLDDPERSRRLSEGGRRFARRSSYRRLAEELLAVVA